MSVFIFNATLGSVLPEASPLDCIYNNNKYSITIITIIITNETKITVLKSSMYFVHFFSLLNGYHCITFFLVKYKVRIVIKILRCCTLWLFCYLVVTFSMHSYTGAQLELASLPDSSADHNMSSPASLCLQLRHCLTMPQVRGLPMSIPVNFPTFLSLVPMLNNTRGCLTVLLMARSTMLHSVTSNLSVIC